MWMWIVSTSKYLLSCEHSVCMSVCESYLHSDHPSSAQEKVEFFTHFTQDTSATLSFTCFVEISQKSPL